MIVKDQDAQLSFCLDWGCGRYPYDQCSASSGYCTQTQKDTCAFLVVIDVMMAETQEIPRLD